MNLSIPRLHPVDWRLYFLLAGFPAVAHFAHVTFLHLKKHMKARDVFGIILRTIGLGLLLYAIRYIAGAITIILGISPYNGIRMALDYLSFAVPTLIIAIVLMLLARQIVGLCYPDNKDDSDP